MKVKLYSVPEISSIQDMLLKSAAKTPNGLALSDLTNFPISRVTYSQLVDKVLKFGLALQALGLKEKPYSCYRGKQSSVVNYIFNRNVLQYGYCAN